MLLRSIGSRLNQSGCFGRNFGALNTPFSPLSLFSAGEVGAWYDFSDFSTMFQDAAGTTPVTAVEQPVGLVLDKSKGLVLGSNIFPNGDFTSSNISSWSLVTGSNTWASEALNATGATYLDFTTVAGRTYLFSAQLAPQGTYNASCRVWVGGGFSTVLLDDTASTASRTKTGYFVATSSSCRLYIAPIGGSGSVTIDNISVKELAGNHASQTTSTSRPVLSARVNLLTYTEQFDNAAWTKFDVTVPSNNQTSPIGSSTANKVAINAASTFHGFRNAQFSTASGAWRFSICAKAAELSVISLSLTSANNYTTDGAVATFNLANGTVSKTGGPAYISSSIESLGSGWYRCTIVGQNSAISYAWVWLNSTSNPTYAGFGYEIFAGTSGHGVNFWGADLRSSTAGSSLPPYQRVGAATAGTSSAAGTGDYDTTGFPYYLKFDGTDDFLVTGTINPGSVDKAQVFAGVRKLDTSAVNNNMILESSTVLSATTGGLNLYTLNDRFRYGLRQTATAVYDATTYNSPITAVTSVAFDIAGAAIAQEIFPRVNGAIPTLTEAAAGPSGNGNFGSYPYYIGARGGSSQWFTGNLYGLILRFSAANLSDATIAQAETWLNSKTKAF